MKKRTWIHCRVSNYTDQHLLDYQKEVLSKFAEENDFEIIGVTKEVSKGSNPCSVELNTLRTHIRRKDIDCILIYDKTRLLIHDDLFMEFQMLCEQKQIVIIDLQDFRNPLATELMLCL